MKIFFRICHLRFPYFFCCFFLAAFFLCGSPSSQKVDLVIRHAAVFDTRTGAVIKDQTIAINEGIIIRVTKDKGGFIAKGKDSFTAKKIIDAKGRLVTPGFIDVHTHLTSVLGDYEQAPVAIARDSVEVYRKRHAQTYLPYGITTVRVVGEPEAWIPMTMDWQLHPAAGAPDIYTCGAALVSREENRKTYINHTVVNDPAAAEAKVQQYYNLGIRDIKLYWLLHYPEFTAALHKAQALGMNVCAHIDRGVVSRDSAIALGLKDLEHVHPYGLEIVSQQQLRQVQDSTAKYFPSSKGGFFGYEMEFWSMAGSSNAAMFRSIQRLQRAHASLTLTLHIFGQAADLSYIKTPLLMENGGLNTEDFTPLQKARCLEGYEVMAGYVKKMFDAGVQLNLGTDCADGGRAALSELLLLQGQGIP